MPCSWVRVYFADVLEVLTIGQNGNWFTFEKTRCEARLISSTVGLTSTLKDKFFFVSTSIFLFTPVWRKHEFALNLSEPKVEELDATFLKNLHSVSVKFRTFLEEFNVYLGLSIKWLKLILSPRSLSMSKVC